MKTSDLRGWGRRKIAACAIPIFIAGCSNLDELARPHESVIAASTRAGEAAGAAEPIAFDITGGAVDVSEASPDTLTLVDAARRALTTHPDIQAALSRVRAAQAEVDQARLFPNPILNVGLRPATQGEAIIDAGLSIDFIAYLTRPGRISAADNRLRAASIAAVSTTLDVLADVQQRYVTVQALDALMPVLEKRRELLARLLSLAESRLRSGEGTRLDVTTLHAQRVDLEVEIDEQQLTRDLERLGLGRLIGQPTGPTDWKLSRWELPRRPAIAETEWVATALIHRPEVQGKQFELAALGADVRIAGLGIFEGNNVGVLAERDDTKWSIGPALSVPIPLFDWGQARRDKAAALVVEARHQLTQTKRQIVEDVRKAYLTFRASSATLDRVRDELVPLQERRREQTEAAYKAGQTDVTTLVLAEQDLQAARTRLIDLQRRASAARIGLERAVGGPRIADQVQSHTPAGTQKSAPATTTPAEK